MKIIFQHLIISFTVMAASWYIAMNQMSRALFALCVHNEIIRGVSVSFFFICEIILINNTNSCV